MNNYRQFFPLTLTFIWLSLHINLSAAKYLSNSTHSLRINCSCYSFIHFKFHSLKGRPSVCRSGLPIHPNLFSSQENTPYTSDTMNNLEFQERTMHSHNFGILGISMFSMQCYSFLLLSSSSFRTLLKCAPPLGNVPSPSFHHTNY